MEQKRHCKQACGTKTGMQGRKLTLVSLSVILLFSVVLVSPVVGDVAKQAQTLLAKSQKAVKALTNYQGLFIKKERMRGRIFYSRMQFKFARPFRLYMKYLRPHKGRELIYVAGWNENKIRAHKGSFPDVTLNLDPRGSMATKSDHHPVTDFGYAFVLRTVSKNLKLGRQKDPDRVKVSVKKDAHANRKTWKLVIQFPVKHSTLKAREEETLWDIATRSGQDMYRILYANSKKYDEPDDVEAGDKVKIPRYYGKKLVLHIDRKRSVPVSLEVYVANDKLYESYLFAQMKHNTGLSDKDFDPENKAYDF